MFFFRLHTTLTDKKWDVQTVPETVWHNIIEIRTHQLLPRFAL